ncbi:50S ribosomal protein L9 [Acetobacterium woodii]|uniref:Large ribosomal subunit protein bL9 n=1 Tax=Acetobacterium woodii (strain ATCC 29683 / DSM 1030 / JCM 2381 / KCTC 1655 / WB1) TaxID=931626 RepID=H6LCF6_ACEWD|nr:50S ribosomal protein L9 [Acetobacterium woodii]AFA50271.1 50S ribosomal protein L9 [Acetobacterium woodii DSM 1030]
MKVVLLENVKNVGNKGDIVEVKDGYGRNFLIKNKKGVIGNKENIEMTQKNKAEEEKKIAAERQAAIDLAKEIDQTEITITERAGEDGKLFGSVTSKDITERLEKEKGIKVDKRKVELEMPIRNIGRVEVKIKTYQGVTGNLTVIIKGEV